MAGLITWSSVLLLARKRLERVEKLLRGKILSGGTVNEIERQVLFLARTALGALNSAPPVSTNFDPDSFTPWLSRGASQYAVLGSVGPEVTKFAAQYAPSQAWLYDSLRAGNPDPERSQVLARSTDFLVRLCERIVAAVDALPPGTARNALHDQLRAFALGYACHIAGALVSAPYVDAVEFELGSTGEAPPRRKLSVQAVRSALEEGVARQLYRRSDARGGDWNGWLPPTDQIPPALFDAFSGAAADVYATALVPPSKAVADRLDADAPPELSADLIRDGYGAYRLLTERGYVWSYGDWLLATLFMFAWPALMFPFSALLPQGRHWRRDDAYFADKPPEEQRDEERAVFEILTFPLAANGVVPLAMSLWLMLGSYRGAGREMVFGIVSGAVTLVAAVVFFATLGSDMPAWARWLFLFALPLALEIAHIVYVLAAGGSGPRRLQLILSSISHILLAFIFVGCFAGFLHFGAEGVVDDGIGSGAFWGYAVLWLVIVAVLWLVTSAILYATDDDLPAPVRDDFATGRKHFLRLFDNTTLPSGPVPSPPATLGQRIYPLDLQPVLKLWWTGGGELYVRSTRDSLLFSFDASGIGDKQTVLAPIAPMTASEFAILLEKSVRDSAGAFSGQLRVERFDDDEPLDLPLGTGQVFADHGDDRPTREEHDAAAGLFRRVPPPDDDPYVLYLAPRRATAIRMGQGQAVLPPDGTAPLAGPGQLQAMAAPGSVNVVGDANTRFLDTFVPGDVIATTGPDPVQSRVVVAVQDDSHLTLNLAFAPFANPQNYQRGIRDRDADQTGPAGSTVATHQTVFRQLVGFNTQFDTLFMPGDRIEAFAPGSTVPESRVVEQVLSASLLVLDLPFSAAIPTMPVVAANASPYRRPGRVSLEGYAYAPTDPTALADGATVLDRAADLASLLCLGTASHLLLDSERAAVATGDDDRHHAAVGKAWQVLRNWNLDHRRANEWCMLIGGNAVSEKHGAADRSDVLQPLMPAAHRTPAAAGEGVANQLGWTRAFGQWLDMASQRANDSVQDRAARAGVPTNLQLSRAVAYLLDLPSPV